MPGWRLRAGWPGSAARSTRNTARRDRDLPARRVSGHRAHPQRRAFAAAARPLFALCDIVIVNEGELADFSGSGDPVAAARRLLDRADQRIVVTLGGDGALAISTDAVITIPAYPATVVETTGAGDCFCGTLAAMLAEGLTLEEALHWVSRAAAYCVGRAAAIPAMSLRAEL